MVFLLSRFGIFPATRKEEQGSASGSNKVLLLLLVLQFNIFVSRHHSGLMCSTAIRKRHHDNFETLSVAAQKRASPTITIHWMRTMVGWTYCSSFVAGDVCRKNMKLSLHCQLRIRWRQKNGGNVVDDELNGLIVNLRRRNVRVRKIISDWD